MTRSDGEKTRMRILEVAIPQLAQFDTLSIGRVAAEADVSNAGLLHHFSTKAALVEAASRVLVVPLYVDVENCLVRGKRSGLDLVEDVASIIFAACRDREHLARFLLRHREADAPTHLLRLASLVTSAIDAGVRDGALFAVDRRVRARQILAIVLTPFLFSDGVLGFPPSWSATAGAIRRLLQDDVVTPAATRNRAAGPAPLPR